MRIRRATITVTIAFASLAAGCGGGGGDGAGAGPPETGTAAPAASPDPAVELDDAVTRALDSECAAHDSVAGLLAGIPGDLRVEDLGIVTDAVLDGEDVTRISTGILFAEWAGVLPTAFTLADGPTGRAHALLFLNHQRTVAALAAFLDRPIAVEVLSRPARSADPGDVFATWDGGTVEFRDTAEPIPASALTFMPRPDAALVVSPQALAEGWDRAGRWAGAVGEITAGGGLERTADLEPFADGLPEERALFCVLYSTEWRLAENALGRHEEDPGWRLDHPEVFSAELAAGELLLAAEYVAAIAAWYEAPEVDWLRADGDHSQVDAFDGVTSTAEYGGLWTYGIEDALARFRTWIEFGAVPLDGR